MNAVIITDFTQQIADAIDATPTDAAEHMTPDMLGQYDAQDGLLCIPEQYYADRIKCALYAAGHAEVAGPTLLSDYWLVGSAVESIEDDRQFIAHGGA